MKKLLLLCAFALTYSSNAQTEIPVEVPTIAIKVPLGEKVILGDVAITFKEVLEDSRCPKDVNCIWEGRIRLQIAVEIDQKAVLLKELLLGATKPGEVEETEIYNTKDQFLEAVGVLPYPTSEDTGDRSYVLLVSEKTR
ncbi:hypothetical protein [Altibacter sp.]|uniref:hypothetical protein n=1 Tax=Altibacter sp. TaxID=2024823 RepID=UPI000C8E5AA6|nr:hypothetical protein [Altibacter sp.]MAP54407.1 hypothetical protein [Altibacter sp.]